MSHFTIEENDPEKADKFARYEIEYNLYADRKKAGKAKGKLVSDGYDGGWLVEFDSKAVPDKCNIAVSLGYNPYPREEKLELIDSDKKLGHAFVNANKQFKVISSIQEVTRIDIDGDQKSEYIVLVVDPKSNFAARCLMTSNMETVSYLKVFHEKVGTSEKDFLKFVEDEMSKDSEEIADINNDGIMEIIENMPVYEESLVNIYTFNNGKFDGSFINMCSLKP